MRTTCAVQLHHGRPGGVLPRDLRAASLAPGGVCCPQTGTVVSRAHRFPEAPPAARYLSARKTLNRWPPLAALRTLLESLVPRSVPSGSLDEATMSHGDSWVGLLSLSQCCFWVWSGSACLVGLVGFAVLRNSGGAGHATEAQVKTPARGAGRGLRLDSRTTHSHVGVSCRRPFPLA